MTYKPGDVLKERYLINEKLGEGSMGEVYRAEHLTLHKQVAIKIMHVHVAEDPKAMARFRREAQAVSALDHPHICQVMDFDTTDKGDFYIVMEYLKGEELRDRLEREGTIPIPSMFRIMIDLLSALECVHENGLVHRDVKPNNIMLKNREGRDDFVKLIDFGIVHSEQKDAIHGTLTQSGQIYGTPQYLSPEQVMGSTVDKRADLYACGCTMYEMIVGVPPFDAENYVMLLNQHLSLKPPHLMDKIDKTKFENIEEVDEVIQKLLQKEPDDRFSSAKEVREILETIARPSVPSLSLKMTNNQKALSEAALLSMNALENVPLSGHHPQIPIVESVANTNRIMIYGIIIGLAVIVIFLGVFIAYIMNRQNALEQELRLAHEHEQALEESIKTTVSEIEQVHPHLEEAHAKRDVETFRITEQLFTRHIDKVCKLLEDDTFKGDKVMIRASDHCLNQQYDIAHEELDSMWEQYKDNMHFLRIYLVDAYALKNVDEVVQIILRLIELDAAVTCDPTVRDIIYELIEDDESYEKLRTGVKVLETPRAAEGIAWLLINSPCNHYQKRFDRLLECYDAITERSGPKWLINSVKVWRPYMYSGSCDERQGYVDQFIIEGLEKDCEGDQSQNSSNYRCKICWAQWKGRKKLPSSVSARNDRFGR